MDLNKGLIIGVIIMVGLLVTLGVRQFGAVIERSRGAEARQILTQLRSECAVIYRTEGWTTNCTAENLGIGTGTDMIPVVCRPTHYFSYIAFPMGATQFHVMAIRCTGDTGKQPGASKQGALILQTDFFHGTDTWHSRSGY